MRTNGFSVLTVGLVIVLAFGQGIGMPTAVIAGDAVVGNEAADADDGFVAMEFEPAENEAGAAESAEAAEPPTPQAPAAPQAFPAAPLAAGSRPMYATFRADPWNQHVVYLMFDGEVTNGYNRLYVWIPDHAQYDRPQPLIAGANGVFPPIQFDASEGNERAHVAYRFQFSARPRTLPPQPSRDATPARTTSSTVFDYETGTSRTVTRTIPAQPAQEAQPGRSWLEPAFAFTMNYTRDRQPFGGANRLALSVAGDISPVGKFEELRGATAPWNGIRYNLSIARIRDGDPQEVILRATGGVTYGEHARCTIETIPKGFMDVAVSVLPYLCDVHASAEPAYRQTHNGFDILSNGLEFGVPFGWQRTAWKAELHPWIGGRSFTGGTRMSAMGRSAPATAGTRQGGLGSGDTPDSRLRGPPPSQLRGPGQ